MKQTLLLTVALALGTLTTFAQGGRGYGDRDDDVYTNNGGGRSDGDRGGYGPGNTPGYGGRAGTWGGDRNNRCDNVDERQYVQQSRIYRGLRDGSLNRWEAQRLQRELSRVEQMEWSFRRNDGRLDGRERRILDGELDRLAWAVRRERNDGDRRWN